MVLPNTTIAGTANRIDVIAQGRPWFFRGDVRKESEIVRCIRTFKPDVIIHLAAQKYMGNDPAKEQQCYDVNVGGTMALLNAMAETGVTRLIYASALEAGQKVQPRVSHFQTKQLAEAVIAQHLFQHPSWSVAVLRQGLIAGAHPTGMLAESEETGRDSVFTHICQTACGERNYVAAIPYLRDYLHVDDLVRAYSSAMNLVSEGPGHHILDIGTGTSIATEHLIQNFELANNVYVRRQFTALPAHIPRRIVANPRKAKSLLKWEARLDIDRMCRDMWSAYITGVGSVSTPPYSRIASCRSLF